MKNSNDISYEKQLAAEFLKDSVVISFLHCQEFKENSSEFHMQTKLMSVKAYGSGIFEGFHYHKLSSSPIIHKEF